MNIFFTPAAQAAFKAAPAKTQSRANAILGTYAQYANRHSLPGKGTLSRLSKEARTVLGLPAGTQVFERGV